MKTSTVLFGALLVAAAGAGVLHVRPAAAAAAAALGKRSAPAEPPPAEAPRGADRAAAARLSAALAALEPGPSAPLPAGILETGPGQFGGTLPWEEVQEFLAWTASQPRTVLSLEVRARPDAPGRASCLVRLERPR